MAIDEKDVTHDAPAKAKAAVKIVAKKKAAKPAVKKLAVKSAVKKKAAKPIVKKTAVKPAVKKAVRPTVKNKNAKPVFKKKSTVNKKSKSVVSGSPAAIKVQALKVNLAE